MNGGSADLWRVLLGLATLALVVWVPGLALHRWLLPGRSQVEALAAAPALSTGVLYSLGELFSALHVRADAGLALSLGLVGALALTLRNRRRGRRPFDLGRSHHAVLSATALGVLLWSLGLRHLTAVAPHNDGYNHGFFVSRIADTHSLLPSQVMPHDVLFGGNGVDFYPLALHQQAAALVQLLDLDVAVAWNVTSLSLVILALPLGLLALGRRLFPALPWVPEACAVLAAALPALTYSTSWWGGFALAAGFAALPGALLLALDATERWRPAPIGAAALGLAGMAGIHTSEYSLLVVLAGVLLLVRGVTRRALTQVLHPFLRLATVGVGSLVLLAPAVMQLLRGLDERAYPVPDQGVPLATALRQVVVQFSFVPPVTPTAVVLAFWTGFLLCLVKCHAEGWVAAWLLFAVVYVWLGWHPSGLIISATATWYSDLFRLGYILAFLSIPFLALAVAGGRSARRRELRLAGPVLGVVLVVTSSTAAVHATRENYQDFSLVGPDERAAFRYLAEHVRPGEHVVNQHQDGSPWMYSLDGVAPLFALKTFDFERPEWEDANYLARHVQAAGKDPEVDRLLAYFHARYVYIGPAIFPTESPDLDRRAIARSPALRQVFSRGGARVYEIVT